ncbi:MAG: hypothetical protein US32_C0014G0002 [candidate division TM6 bacterium GW2011_GWA2_36_9]|nr:MAG: hypothetical protein US32_C0014G0002 [candidate division TM6 bacterium GW2011_GWA2_36_9]
MKFRFICLLFSFLFLHGEQDAIVPFSQSFIEGFCFNPESRFSREYHPYLLKKTKDSLQNLEHYLQGRKFSLSGRMLIMGYEQNAVPRYFDCLSQKQIEDEVVTIHKVPILGDIPLIGSILFQNKTVGKTKRDLVVFMTPHIIR